MGKVTELKSKDICQFCGASPDHKGFWQCPRLRAVSFDPDGSWSVEFVDQPEDDEPEK